MPRQIRIAEEHKRIRETLIKRGQVTRIRNAAIKERNRLRTHVYKVKIRGREMLLIESANQIAERDNIEKLFSSHQIATTAGKIKIEHYKLERTPYVYTDPNVAVIDHENSFGAGTLLITSRIRQEKRANGDGARELAAYTKFLLEHPKVTRAKLRQMIEELQDHLKFLAGIGKNMFSYDLKNLDKIQISGFDEKSGKLHIWLLEQIDPDVERDLAKNIRLLRAKLWID